MELSKAVDQAFAEALRSKDSKKLDAFRMLRASIKNKAIELRKPELTDEEIVSIIRSEIKKRKESIELYTQAGRDELAVKEKEEIDILQVFLPEEASDDEVLAQVSAVVAGLPEEDRANFGKVMGSVMKALQGKVEGNRVSEFVKKALQK